MSPKQKIKHITAWIKKYATSNKISTLVVGVSGGIDSAVVSTLCAQTGLPTVVLSMPIKQSKATHYLSQLHCAWLVNNFANVKEYTINLTSTFKQFEKITEEFNNELAYANSRSRLRMMTLYQVAQASNGIVIGTGNRVEDFGVGFFTKYGDGGVDISPIGDCLKTEVWAMGKELGVLSEIISAPPTDGLWDDERTDEDQIGMSYLELERMMLIDSQQDISNTQLSKEDRSKLTRYQKLRSRNLHKMNPIPVCKIQ